jgi:hypothetical protein
MFFYFGTSFDWRFGLDDPNLHPQTILIRLASLDAIRPTSRYRHWCTQNLRSQVLYRPGLKAILFVDRYPTKDECRAGCTIISNILYREGYGPIEAPSAPSIKEIMYKTKEEIRLLKTQDPHWKAPDIHFINIFPTASGGQKVRTLKVSTKCRLSLDEWIVLGVLLVFCIFGVVCTVLSVDIEKGEDSARRRGALYEPRIEALCQSYSRAQRESSSSSTPN